MVGTRVVKPRKRWQAPPLRCHFILYFISEVISAVFCLSSCASRRREQSNPCVFLCRSRDPPTPIPQTPLAISARNASQAGNLCNSLTERCEINISADLERSAFTAKWSPACAAQGSPPVFPWLLASHSLLFHHSVTERHLNRSVIITMQRCV